MLTGGCRFIVQVYGEVLRWYKMNASSEWARGAMLAFGGEKEIRTLERVAPLHAFQACSFNHSDTSPGNTRAFRV
jgi:hypothetical protein